MSFTSKSIFSPVFLKIICPVFASSAFSAEILSTRSGVSVLIKKSKIYACNIGQDTLSKEPLQVSSAPPPEFQLFSLSFSLISSELCQFLFNSSEAVISLNTIKANFFVISLRFSHPRSSLWLSSGNSARAGAFSNFHLSPHFHCMLWQKKFVHTVYHPTAYSFQEQEPAVLPIIGCNRFPVINDSFFF